VNYVRGFLPWLAFSVVAARIDWRYSALVGLAVAAALLLWDRWARRPLDASTIQLSAAVFFGLLALFAFAVPDSPLRTGAIALSSGWLALTAWASLIARRPFTLGIAKQMADPARWHDPRFVRVNVTITTVWAVSFTAATIALAAVLAYAPGSTVALVAVKAIAWAVPMTFTLYYPAVLRARAARTAHEPT